MYGCRRTSFTRSYRAARSSQAVHMGFQGQGWHWSCADTDAGKCHYSCSNGGQHGQQGWKPQQPCGYKVVSIVGAQHRLTSFQLCLPQAWQTYKADTREQEPLQQVQLNLPFKKADVFRKILKKPNSNSIITAFFMLAIQ